MNNPTATINVPHAAPAEALFNLKFHQVAIYNNTPQAAVSMWREMGFGDWHHDVAVLRGKDRGEEEVKTASMYFNYDIMPLELEYVSYFGRRNRLDHRDGSVPFISHLSTIVEDVDYEVARIDRVMLMRPYHRFTTEQHTNPNVKGRKRFREAIYDTQMLFGFDIKLIQRVPWDWAEQAEVEG